jgi:bacillithiol biosynthesis cysteine-adding enzyme BshC
MCNLHILLKLMIRIKTNFALLTFTALMDCTSTQLPYKQTGYFSRIVEDYLDQSPLLRGFYEHEVTLEGIEAAVENRKRFPTNRKLLQSELRRQYAGINTGSRVTENIDRLIEEDTFTVCTAHQPAIFTGTLYFIYKILHAIKLADHLNEKMPQHHFVPVYYMGSEDADLDELGHIHLDGKKLSWETRQTGAVGRMSTKGLEKIISEIDGQFSVLPHGSELVDMLRRCYLESADIQTATFKLVNELFADHGLIVLIPDNPNLKRVMSSVFTDDLLEQVPSGLVEESVSALDKAGFKVQAHPRDINLFYLKDNLRERFIQNGSGYKVHDSHLKFSTEELQQALEQQPEVFSPNVILRGLFQETILPDVAFIGGGGELAYWLEFKKLLDHYSVPFPVLVLRNSFLLIEKKWKDKMEAMGLDEPDIFLPEQDLLNKLVKEGSSNQLDISQQIAGAKKTYADLKAITDKIDTTLTQHVTALETAALEKLEGLEKKLLRAERRKFADHQRQIETLRQALFPQNSLQERVENFMPSYAKWGREFLNIIYEHSNPFQEGFAVISTD